jgi:hypothetical protein
MQKVYLSHMLQAVAMVLLLGLLGACSHDDLKKGTSDATNAPAQYDLLLRADKDGQFDLEGATLTAEDLRSHIRYRNEPGNQPVRTLLLKPGEKEKIKNTHISALAGIARDLKIAAYVEDNDGRLKVIQIVE